MVFSFDDSVKTVAKLKVVGVGGAGGNAINRMVTSGLQGVEFIAVNTDAMALEHNRADVKIQIGTKLTGGLGAGANPNVGNMSMQEDRERVRAQLEGADMVFIAAGMGGGTGTGAAPVVAEIAREMGILTVAVVTKPFLWEGPVRDKNATGGLDALRKNVDTVIVVPNQKLLSVVSKSTPLREAFKMADDILSSATRGISEIILKHGDIQVDFADVRAIMSQGGDALMGTGHASGENRATIAADRAIHSPLLDNVSIAGATGVLVNITGGEDLGIMEVNDAMNFIYEAVGTDTQANIIFGTVINPDFKDEIAITVIATGFGQVHMPKQLNPNLAKGLDPSRRPDVSRPAPSYPAYAEPKQPIVEPFRDMGYDRPAPSERIVAPERGLPPERYAPADRIAPVERLAPPERVAGFQDRSAPLDRSGKPAEEVPPSRVPFARQAPGQVPGKAGFGYVTPAPRDDENRVLFNDPADPSRKSGTVTPPGQKGRYKDLDPDIDYETPAFLRNQAD
ncbi:MAG TPA: cell division protein FtsZ [Fibrobacteria bacterium]|nr:cell division protein FtsZ [Fibrobacteria bacterium]